MSGVSGPKSDAFLKASGSMGGFAVSDGLLLRSVPSPPDDLDEEGSLWWNYYCGIFVEGNVMSKLFVTSMHNLCLQHMIRANIMHELSGSETGIMIEEWYVNKEKEPVTRRYLNPLVDKLEKCMITMDRLLSSLGMTAYTARVNSFDTSGAKGKLKSKAPPAALPLPRN